jgi:Ni,Fe-hydrogenase III large subunit
MTAAIPFLRNKQTIPVKDIPLFDEDAFAQALSELLAMKYRVCAYFGDRSDSGQTHLYALCADDINGSLYVLSGTTRSGHFPSLTRQFPQMHLFEREIFEQTGTIPDGHPWLKPVRFPLKTAGGGAATQTIGQADFFHIHGEEIHQVAVGPVHAGVIEPGHFRFQCHGETVYHLEISLGYQHRGIEGAMKGGPFAVTPFQMEAVSGDATIGHMTAYCEIIESLMQRQVSPNANLIRAFALELERCANHTGDLGALAGDVGFLPTLSYCGRIRGDFLNMTALICGNRFGRGLVIPGGIGYDIEEKRRSDLSLRLQRVLTDFLGATGLLWKESSVMDRFESTGTLSEEIAEEIGLVGPVARACGCVHDVRQDHAHGFYRFAHIPVATYDTGDVFGRAYVRWREVQTSGEFLLRHLPELEGVQKANEDRCGPQTREPLMADALTVSLVEGWRGEICHVAITDQKGRIRRYKIVDPSFHNWFGLALALRNQEISDFPLCNKSFNLSYCGFDL